ncbi:MAG: hypothetical protein U0T73_07490 [Chitinophagales bacterium]|nr:hypothetical protein [Chitinophagales bacterium]
MIFIESKKKGAKTLAKLYPKAEIIDVTSKGIEPYVRLSPFYPHGNIPVPFSPNTFSYSVEGIWQGLKVFEQADIDTSKFAVKNMKGIKRTARKFGKPLGHRKGVNGTELLDYLTARKQIYLPSYAWLLQNKTTSEVDQLTQIALRQDVVLLDFETNSEIDNTKKPLSHAALIKKFIDKKYPELTEKRFTQPLEPKPKKKKSDNESKQTSRRSKKTIIDKPDDQSQMKLNF